jgi:hypothetical protein
MAPLAPLPQSLSSVNWLGPIRDARPENFDGMHAIDEVFGQNIPGTDAGNVMWLSRSVFKEE